ncbi:MAG TPA: long-chain fatty acid--CoA ligase, partial [Pyrinomonadaceae bacterium]|nr:long-chain fatty acid--CoA ligase [Pyrinomonadaceae bacterium]
SAETFADRVRHVALGLAALGIKRGDRVALLSENRPEWSITDLAILSLGAINVPIYTTQAIDQIRYILTDSGTRAIFISNRRLYKHARQALERLGFLENLIFFDAEGSEGVERALSLDALEAKGREQARHTPVAFAEYLSAVRPQDLATIIYTSGTTGEPKGVMLTHNNFISNVLAITNGLPISSTDVALSVLPLSHIFERTGFYVFCYNGMSVYYAASFDQVGENLREVRPTVMTAVPRLFEKVYHRIVKKGMSEKGWKRKVFLRALAVGQRYAELKDKHQRVPRTLALQQKIASRLVFSKWREGVGGRLRYFVSGGAPLSPALSYSFLAAGIPVLQGYGATETCIVSANRPENNHVGSVGLPFAGIELAIAEDGEIMVRGPNVMQGYYGQPEATAAVMKDGWFATGDVGHLDECGRLYITDRKKDLFKLSNGKYVAPQLIESLLKQSEFVSQVVVVGTGRKQPAALIVPEWEAVKQELSAQGEDFPQGRNELSQFPAAIKMVQRDVAALTSELADYERIRRIALLPDEFTIDNGELTPTLKVKRRVIDEKFGELIGELYS